MDENLYVFGVGKREDKFISFAQDKSLFENASKYDSFIRGCEAMARNDARYTRYVGRVRQAGLNHCAILGDLTQGDSDMPLEMHHGPVFNMYAICDIITRASILRGEIVTTFDIADKVLTEHELNNIMVVMLATVPHKSNHNPNTRGIFISLDATVGRLDRFIDRWEDGFDQEHHESLERYLADYETSNGSVDNGLFDTFTSLKKFD